MLVFTSDFIVGVQIHQLTDKAHHLLVPGHVGHGKTARRTLSTVGNTLWKQTVTGLFKCHRVRASDPDTLREVIQQTNPGLPGGSDGKESACNAGDPGSISGLGRSLGEGNVYPL